MSALVSRLLLTMLMFPLAGIVYLIIGVVGSELMRSSGLNLRERDLYVFLIAGIVSNLFIAAYWMVLWARTVKWTPWRTGATVAMTFGALLLGLLIGWLASLMMESHDSSFGVFVGTVVAPLLWLAGTILIWRETAKERGERLSASRDAVACPTCGYNLTGLSSTRCPECGATFTLDALLRAQPARAAGDLERA